MTAYRRNLLEELVARVNDLNACANARGKGRSDMTVEVLEAAAKVFLQAGRLMVTVNPRQSTSIHPEIQKPWPSNV